MPLNSGQVLHNRYRIVKLLGQGGFGAVYRAWDVNLNGPCAIKENFDTSPAAQQQFAREASLLYNLRHPNLPRVTDHFSIPDQGQYLVMDFIDGEDLQEMMERTGGPLPEAQALPWIGQICDALQYLHTQDPPVIHRDLKPANIRITKDGQAMLVDFGIAKVYDAKLRTTVGARAVTPGFSPPEQYGQGKTDAQSDIYALGATLYALLTGHTAPDSVDVLTRTAPAPVPARTLNPAVSPHVSAAIERAMQSEKSARFGSMAEFKAALHNPAGVFAPPPAAAPLPVRPAPSKVEMPYQAAAGGRPAAVPSAAPKLAAQPAARKRSAWPWIILGVILVGAVVCAVGFSLLAKIGDALTAVTLEVTDWPEITDWPVVTDTPLDEILPDFATDTPWPTETPELAPEPLVPTTEAPFNAAGEITLWHPYASGSADELALQKILAVAQGHYPSMKITPVYIPPAELIKRFQNEASSGGGPDVLLAAGDELGALARNKQVLELDGYLSESQLEQFTYTSLEGMRVGDRLYGLPVSVEVLALYYRPSMIPEPPVTTDDLLTMVSNGSKIVNAIGSYPLFGWMGAFGGWLLDGDGRCIADQGGWTDALYYLLDLQEKGAVFERDYTKAENIFLSGQAPMFVNGTWGMEKYQSTFGEDVAVASLPIGPMGSATPMASMTGFYVNPATKDVKLAVELVIYLTSQEAAQLFTDIAGHPQVRLDVFSENPLVEGFSQAAITGYPRPTAAGFPNFWKPFDDMFPGVLSGAVTPEAGIQKACAAMNAANGK